jgi:hypothetical protein
VARRAWNNRSSNPKAYRKALKEYDRDGNSVLRGETFGVEEGMKPTAKLHKILVKDRSYQIGGLWLPSGDFTAFDQEVAHHLLETHFPGCQPFHQQQEVSELQEDYTIWNGIAANQVKYLGVILDEKRNWNSHIDHRMQKATIVFW